MPSFLLYYHFFFVLGQLVNHGYENTLGVGRGFRVKKRQKKSLTNKGSRNMTHKKLRLTDIGATRILE